MLAALFSYPGPSLLDALPRFLAVLTSFLSLPWPAELQQVPDLLDLEVAYTGLFINSLGGAAAPPYGSVYLDLEAQLMGASCLRVAKSYASEGLNLAASEEPADFLATELEFLNYLVNEEEVAEMAGDAPAATGWRQKQAIFGGELFHPWVAHFCQRIKLRENVHPLYRWGADVLNLFSKQEQGCFAG